jgi:hypothetical protein
MQHPNHQMLLIGSAVGVLAATVTAGILTRRHILRQHRKAGQMNDEPLGIDPKHPSNMEYLVLHNAQGF